MCIKTILSIVFLVFSTQHVFSQKKPLGNAQLRHVVLFKFNETSSADDVQHIEKAFGALPQKIKEEDVKISYKDGLLKIGLKKV